MYLINLLTVKCGPHKGGTFGSRILHLSGAEYGSASGVSGLKRSIFFFFFFSFSCRWVLKGTVRFFSIQRAVRQLLGVNWLKNSFVTQELFCPSDHKTVWLSLGGQGGWWSVIIHRCVRTVHVTALHCYGFMLLLTEFVCLSLILICLLASMYPWQPKGWFWTSLGVWITILEGFTRWSGRMANKFGILIYSHQRNPAELQG